ncbi:MAG: nucleoside 2-deoxyribosyltransferase [candidate division KSB1 bacterium]|nr:nucleoside 2-deoxyribosyltransferase [candidate division KSB1 bacterium]MDZ7345998.1 nucleoside 2-deoxyribosyltransferase [candidate division KSB1 bacterium]
MVIYFCGSIAGSREFADIYGEMVCYLQALGHTVPTEHIIAPNVWELERQFSAQQIYERDMAWLRAADAVIAEISAPSLGVGYEIGAALAAGKRVLALYAAGRRVSCMITGNPDPRLTVSSYTCSREWRHLIDLFVQRVAEEA